jgi:hypothetical protein
MGGWPGCFLSWEKKTAKSFDKKICEKSISVSMNHAMSLLGELHKNECDSYSCVQVRVSETTNEAISTKTLPLLIIGQDPPPCLKPCLWNEPSKGPTGHPTSHHCNNCTISASPSKSSNSTLGSRHYNKRATNANPGKAMNDTWGTSRHNNNRTFSKSSAKRPKAETHHHCNGESTSTDAATGLPRIWPRDMMNIIDLIIKLHSPHPVALFAFEVTTEAAKKNFLILRRFNFDIKQVLEVKQNPPWVTF